MSNCYPASFRLEQYLDLTHFDGPEHGYRAAEMQYLRLRHRSQVGDAEFFTVPSVQ